MRSRLRSMADLITGWLDYASEIGLCAIIYIPSYTWGIMGCLVRFGRRFARRIYQRLVN